jgi:dinuclear metal center YbgI/SA1388 family protein
VEKFQGSGVMIKNYLNMELKDLVSSLNAYLNIAHICESAINGLQVKAHPHVKHIALAVSANMRTIETARTINADTLIVHHGLYWGKENLPISGIFGQRIQALLKNNINLIAYHLPLDVHPIVGNNAQLGLLLNLTATPDPSITPHGLLYRSQTTTTLEFLLKSIAHSINPHVNYYPSDKVMNKEINTIAWCSGAGGDLIEQAGAQCLITGEIAERHFDLAKEMGTTLITAGHYATERCGIQRLGLWIEETLNVKTTFIESESPL